MNLRVFFTALLAVVASALCMVAATASATTVTAPEGTSYTSSLVAASEGHVNLSNPVATIQCSSKFEGKVESHGEGVTAKASVSGLSFTSCTNSWHVTTAATGSLEIHATELGRGTVTSSGATIEATRFGITCRYATKETAIGTLTGSYTTGGNATLDIEAKVPFHSGSGLCGSEASSWTGSYEVTTPALLTIQDPNPVPAVEINAPGGQNFKEGEEKEFSIEDNKGKLDWTLVKVDVVVASGGWQLEEANNCLDKTVTQKQGLICKVKVKCTKKGDAEFRMHLSWSAGKKVGIPLSEMKCT